MNPSIYEQKNVAPMHESVAHLRVTNSGLKSFDKTIPEVFYP